MIRPLALLPMLLLLASCQIAVRVRVTGTPEAPVIELERESGGAPAILGLAIGSEGQAGSIWSIGSDQCIEVSSVVYGHAPAGFREAAPAPRLQSGRNYDVSLIGCGASGSARFAIIGGRIVETGP